MTNNRQNRRLYVLHEINVQLLSNLQAPFAVLMSSALASKNLQTRDFVRVAANNECYEICCFGESAETLHDFIDDLLIADDQLDVVTTWHDDEPLSDTIFYFLNLAGGKPQVLIALIEKPSKSWNILHKATQAIPEIHMKTQASKP